MPKYSSGYCSINRIFWHLRKCQNILFMEQYPDEYNKLTKKLADSFDKKEKKLKKQLEDLDNDNTEEA